MKNLLLAIVASVGLSGCVVHTSSYVRPTYPQSSYQNYYTPHVQYYRPYYQRQPQLNCYQVFDRYYGGYRNVCQRY